MCEIQIFIKIEQNWTYFWKRCQKFNGINLIILNGSIFLFFYNGKQQPEETVSLNQSQNHSIKKRIKAIKEENLWSSWVWIGE